MVVRGRSFGLSERAELISSSAIEFQQREKTFPTSTENHKAPELPSMRLFLIRHGETVDNVAGLYAGTLDSALTNHGVEQANRLGEFFTQNEVIFSHIFASPLSRAFRTA